MLTQRTRRGDVERLLIDDSQAVLVVERDAHAARVLSWNDRNEEWAIEAPAAGQTCTAACPHAAPGVRPTMVQITIDRRRQDVHWWATVLRLMAMRPEICSRCSLLTRWAGLYWCGRAWPVRQWRRITAWLIACVTCANVAAQEPGCGCCLNLKWRMLVTPRTWLRMAAATVRSLALGEPWEWEETEAACPYGLWPTAL